jgi:hypothetical protein
MIIVIVHMHKVLEPIDGGLCDRKFCQSFNELLICQLFSCGCLNLVPFSVGFNIQ